MSRSACRSRRLAEGAPFSIAETKRILASRPAELGAVLAEEVRAQPQLPAGADFAEGSRAFSAGRAPRFTGPTTTERACGGRRGPQN
ncbi:hypothetical protein [Streptomyces coeruleorubidus]|uniref:hypothetical protein n=1 Tax=Streptomyces coeruleorubidus TaxID=116188 RepID=UPI0036510D8C